MKDKTLLIMAAGMGSRFGGLKQIEPIGPNGEFIIDYSIYDAIRNGFTKVVFIIKEENLEIFKDTVGRRIESKIPVEYVFQRIEDLPQGYDIPEGRVKPWGTGHAILSAKDVIKEPFLVINSDDFYGNDAFRVASEFMSKEHNSDKKEYSIIGYKVINTLTENGSVKRGVCVIENGRLVGLKESKIEQKGDIIEAEALADGEIFNVTPDTLVSMNMLTFTPDLFGYLDTKFTPFLEENKNNMDKCEYLIPDVLAIGVKEGYCNVSVVETNAKWCGVTYKEDKDGVVNYIQGLINNGEYSNNLWQ